MQTSLALIAALLAAVAPATAAGPAAGKNPRVTLDTSKGKIVIELFADKAPKSVANFVDYVKSGQYTGTIFHRVIAGFMIQGGGFAADGQQKATKPPIVNESDNGESNARGTIAMARTSDPNSATAQFYINVVNNASLDYKASPQRWGYAVFGKVVEGMSVVDAIAAVKTGSGPAGGDWPVEPVTITKATVN